MLIRYGKVTRTAKTTRPAMILPLSYICITPLSRERLTAEVRLSLLFSRHHQGIRHKLMNACHPHPGHPVIHQARERGPVDGAHIGEHVHAVSFMDVTD